MDTQLIKLGEQLQTETLLFLATAMAEIKSNRVFGRCEILMAFASDSFRGVVASGKGGSPMGVIRSARGLFETYIDTCLVANAQSPAAALDDMYDYSYLEQAKFRRIHDPKYVPTPQEVAAEQKFKNPASKKANGVFKHWSRHDSVENRVKAAGQGHMYDSFYRIASFATHGCPSFAVLYGSKQILKIQEDFFQMSIGLAVDAVENCLKASNVQDAALLACFARMVAIRKQVIATIRAPGGPSGGTP